MSDRRTHRLRDYDYRASAAYFVTITTAQRVSLFRSSAFFGIAVEEWERTSSCPGVALDAFVVMPNHVHGILILDSPVGAQRAAPLQGGSPERAQHAAPPQGGPPPGSLGAVVRGYKAAVTRRINSLRRTPKAPVWQRNYYEHVIRGERELDRIRAYVRDNPARWAIDRENPRARPDSTETAFWQALEVTT